MVNYTALALNFRVYIFKILINVKCSLKHSIIRDPAELIIIMAVGSCATLIDIHAMVRLLLRSLLH